MSTKVNTWKGKQVEQDLLQANDKKVKEVKERENTCDSVEMAPAANAEPVPPTHAQDEEISTKKREHGFDSVDDLVDMSDEATAADSPGAIAVPGPEASEYDRNVILSRHVTVSPGNAPVEVAPVAEVFSVNSAFLVDPEVAVIVEEPDGELLSTKQIKKDSGACCSLMTPFCAVQVKRLNKRILLRCACFFASAMVLIILILFGLRVFRQPDSPGLQNYYNNPGFVCDIQKISPLDSAPESNFGGDITLDGSTLVAAAIRPDGTKCAYVFKAEDGIWVEEQKLVPEGIIWQGFSKMSVAVSGNTAIIGQSGDDPNGIRSGSALVFVRTLDGKWAIEARLIPDDGAEEDMFGFSVDIDGDTALVGAAHKHGRKDIMSTHPEDAEPGDRSHDGSAYIFTRTEGKWTQEAKLTDADGHFQDRFGFSVALDAGSNTAIVGADGDDDADHNSGSAHVFTRSGTNWTFQSKLVPEDRRKGDHFGTSVDLVGDLAIVGAKFHDDHANPRIKSVGAAYLFRRNKSGWSQEAELMASDGEDDDTFGHSVALHKSVAVVGSWKDSDVDERSGAAYLFKQVGGTWTESGKLAPNDLGRKFYFGGSVAVGENIVVVGAGGADGPNGPDSGVVYSIDIC